MLTTANDRVITLSFLAFDTDASDVMTVYGLDVESESDPGSLGPYPLKLSGDHSLALPENMTSCTGKYLYACMPVHHDASLVACHKLYSCHK